MALPSGNAASLVNVGRFITPILLVVGASDVQEAARVDRARRWARLWRVTLPLLRRTLALTVILSVVGSMLAFDQFYIMTNGGPANQTLTVAYWIYDSSFVNFQLGYGAAMSVVLTVILVLITALQLYLLRDQTE